MTGLPSPVHAGDNSHKAAAMAALKVAKHYYKAKEFNKAAERFHEAYRIDPNPAFLFNAARAEMRAFKLNAAEKNFKRYLGLKGIDSEGRRRAKVHLEEVADQRKVIADQNKAIVEHKQRAVVAEKRAATAAKTAPRSDWLTVGLWAGGGAVLATSGLLYLLARAGRTDTNAMVVTNDQELQAHNEQVESQNGLRNVAVGFALLGAGLGTWAVLRSGSDGDATADASSHGLRVAPWFDGRGLAIGGRF